MRPGQPLPEVSSAAKAGGIRQVSAEDEKTDFFTGSQWSVAEEDQKEVMSQRGQTEGSIGTLKRYGFSGRRERSNQTVEAAGQRAMVSLNLNKLMRDLGAKDKQARKAAA